MLSHDVYFTLADPTPANAEALVAGCHRHLAGSAGLVFFSAGTRVEELTRPVNDVDFHVALHMFFTDRAVHDAYQPAPNHLAFIEECQSLWSAVRIFDSTGAEGEHS